MTIRYRHLLAALLITASVLHGGPAVAAEDAEWATCHLSGAVQLTPGLREAPQDIDLTVLGEFTACATSDPAITSGTLTATGSGIDLTCLQNSPFTGTADIAWNTGDTSVMQFTTKGLGPAGSVVGTVTGGTRFVGTIFTGPVVFTGDLTSCRQPGGLTAADFEERSTLS